MNVPNSFIHKSQKPETTQLSTNRMDKHTVAYAYNEIINTQQ